MAIELWEIEMFLRFCLLSSLGRAQEGGKKVGLSECLCRGSVKVAIEDLPPKWPPFAILDYDHCCLACG